MMSNHSKSLLIMLALISVILVTVLVLGIYDIRAKNKNASELLNLADQDAKMEILSQSIKVFQNDAKQDLEYFDNFVLSDDKLVPLIESIEEAGRVFSLETDIISVDKKDNKESAKSYTVQITIETRGSWPSTASFLHSLESLPYRVIVNEADLFKENDLWSTRVVLLMPIFN